MWPRSPVAESEQFIPPGSCSQYKCVHLTSILNLFSPFTFQVSMRHFLFCLLCSVAILSRAADSPQWCGSDCRNMISTEIHLPADFVIGEKNNTVDISKKGCLWRYTNIDPGFSTPSFTNGSVFVADVRGVLYIATQTPSNSLQTDCGNQPPEGVGYLCSAIHRWRASSS